MARLWSCGFELNSLTLGVELSTTVTGGNIVSTGQRSGSYAYRNNPSASIHVFSHQYSGGTTTTYLRYYYYVNTHPAAGSLLMGLLTTGSVALCRLRGSGSGIRLHDSADTQQGSDIPLNSGQWYRIELRFTANGASSTVELRVDGVSQYTSSSFNGGSGTPARLQIGSGGSLTHDYLVDDIAINDATGTAQNSFPGDSKLILLLPNATGDSNSFSTQVGGTAGSSNNFTRVNEIPPDDATSYNGSDTAGTEEFYNVTSPGLAAGDTINVVQWGVRARNSTADATLAMRLIARKTSGGTVYTSNDVIANSTTWRTNNASNSYLHTRYVDPDGAAWTNSTIDSMQFGYKIETGPSVAGRRFDISTVWAYVDYTPGATGNASTLTLLGAGA